MAKIVSIHSFRGGTGKSNTTANIAALIARAGHRVGVIDTDIHSPGIHVIFGLEPSQIRHTLNDYLRGRCSIVEAAYDVTAAAGPLPNSAPKSGRVFLIPSSIQAGEIAQVLRDGYDIGKLTDGFRALIKGLELDYLLIDTHPGVNEETLLSIALSDVLLLILRPDNQDLQGTAVALELARRLEVREILTVINKVPPGVELELLRFQVEAAFNTPVISMLPLNSEIAQLASSAVFVVRQPDHPMNSGFRQIADRLMER